MEAIKVKGLIIEQCMLLVIVLLPVLTICKQENVPDQGPPSSRKSTSNNKETVIMTLEEEVISAPAQSPTPAARTVSLMNHQLELGIRALQEAQLLDQDPTFVRATLPSALNVMNASPEGKLVQLVTASRLILYHDGRVDPMKDECHYQIKH